MEFEFYSASDTKRPIRLCDSTRKFSYESLNHKYGKDTRKNPAVSLDLDNIKNIDSFSDLEKYNAGILVIAKNAPLRVCPNELICGAATLGNAINHMLPVEYHGKPLFESYSGISHLTPNYTEILKIGYRGLREKIKLSLGKNISQKQKLFLQSCLHCVDCFEIWHKRYLNKLQNMPGYENQYKNLCVVPEYPATCFYEAVQSLWFTFAFMRLTGNWPGIGRIDVILGEYLKNDLEKGLLTISQAREILAHFFIKGCEWICGGDYGSGDAQHYQNIVLSGIDSEGNDVTNEVTFLVLDIVEELGISDFPITVRINKNTDKKLLRRIAQVIRHGGGVIAVYNEDIVIKALTDFGYPLSEARNFANDGCWEVQIPGKTNFSYIPFDSLAILQKNTLNNYLIDTDIKSFKELYGKYIHNLSEELDLIYKKFVEPLFISGDNSEWKEMFPCTIVSLFEHDCIERGLSYREGGPVYNIISPHIGGISDVANSLYAIKKLVFDEKKLSFKDFMKVLYDNWEGNEPLRQYVLSSYNYYGNDNDEVDYIAADILSDFSDICSKYNSITPIKFPSGVSTFGRQIEWAPNRIATPSGRKKGEILSGNFSPTPGTDKEGATAIIKSYCKADLSKQVTGAALDIGLLPYNVRGEDGLDAIISLISGFVTLGGYFMQIDISDPKILHDAQLHPENYPTLSVRVSGWNARFVTLNREWQNMIIEKSAGKL